MEKTTLPNTIADAKILARSIRQEYASSGHHISHSKSLEILAHRMGYSNWNIASARLRNTPEFIPQIGDRIRGNYLKQAFHGSIIAVRNLADGEHFEVTTLFDAPIDVVQFDSFSAFRQRVTATLDKSGRCVRKTSDGEPHMVVLETNNHII